MNGLIKLKLSELNTGFVEHIKTLLQGNDEAELTLTFDDRKNNYFEVLDRSIKDLENGHNLITFTMEELENYTKSKTA